jgi:hypothetical protein
MALLKWGGDLQIVGAISGKSLAATGPGGVGTITATGDATVDGTVRGKTSVRAGAIGEARLLGDGASAYVGSYGSGNVNLVAGGATVWQANPAGGLYPLAANAYDLGVPGLELRTVYCNTVNVGGNQVLGPRRTGWGAVSGTLSRAAFDSGTATAAQVAQTVAAILTDLKVLGSFGA